jgi:hypothetical protein
MTTIRWLGLMLFKETVSLISISVSCYGSLLTLYNFHKQHLPSYDAIAHIRALSCVLRFLNHTQLDTR